VNCLQETMKTHFSMTDLRNLVGGQSFSWNCISARGHSRGKGGALVGVRQGDLDAEEMGEVEHFSWVKKR
jgi:hypothetical protein